MTPACRWRSSNIASPTAAEAPRPAPPTQADPPTQQVPTVVETSEPPRCVRGFIRPVAFAALALLLAATMMLDHVGRNDLTHRMRKGIDQTLNEDKIRTGNLGGTASTEEFVQAIVDRLSETVAACAPRALDACRVGAWRPVHPD